MIIYVDANAGRGGNGSKEMPFRRISDAAEIALPGDEVLVMPRVYREYVNPKNAGRTDARITYRSTEPLGAEITGAEIITGWTQYKDNIWTASVDSSIFGDYTPYTTYVYGDWYFAEKSKHTGALYMNDCAFYEAGSIDEVIAGERSETSWQPENSVYKWYAEEKEGKTVFYANFQGSDPNKEKVEINVRRRCFMPSKTGVSYIRVL